MPGRWHDAVIEGLWYQILDNVEHESCRPALLLVKFWIKAGLWHTWERMADGGWQRVSSREGHDRQRQLWRVTA
jgi:hypothetical protein